MNAVAAANCPAYDLTPVAQALLVIADEMMSDGRVNVLDADERERFDAALVSASQNDVYGTGLAEMLATVLERHAVTYRKPRVVAESETLYLVAFDDHVTWSVRYALDSYGEMSWTASGDYTDPKYGWLPCPAQSFRVRDADEAFGAISGFYFGANLPAWGKLADVHALAQACEDDRNTYTKTVKRIAKERFGAKVSARGNRGTAWSWVDISIADDDNSAGAHAVMQALTGSGRVRRSEQTSPCRGERFATICKLAGHPTPEGFTVATRDWD